MSKPVKKKHAKSGRPSGGGWVRNGIVLYKGEQCEWWVNHSTGKMQEKFKPLDS